MLTMTMYMYIVMNMNIYITKENQERLQQLSDWSMSGLINYLLSSYWESHDIITFKKEVEPQVRAIVKDTPPPGAKVPKESPGKVFEFCKHNNVRGMCKYGCK